MKIISPFKDYYDYLSTQYGVDNNIVYHRPTEINIEQILGKEKAEDIKKRFNSIAHCFNYEITVKNILYIFNTVSILGSIFVFVTKRNTDGSVFSRLAKQEDFSNIIELSRTYRQRLKKFKDTNVNSIKYDPNRYRSFGGNYGFIEAWANGTTKVKDTFLHNRNGFTSDKIGVLRDSNNTIMNIHKELEQPVFTFNCFHGGLTGISTINFNSNVTIEIPNLSQIQGISGVISTFEIYQGISNFFVELKGNEDLNPPVELANNDKIVKAGFDIKTSFRHPINVIRKK